jgi:sigma-E factor negative regulatory protein RseA
MNERNKESLSALMDGEADELEIRRVLNQLDKDDELRDHWKNYHLMGSLMRDESFDSLDLTRGVNQILDGERASTSPADIDTPRLHRKAHVQKSRSAWYKPLTSIAVAASVTLAVLLGVQSIEPDKGLGLADHRANTSQAPQGELTASILTIEEQQQLESAQQQLQDYILQNSFDSNEEKKGILPFARVVEFQSQGK